MSTMKLSTEKKENQMSRASYANVLEEMQTNWSKMADMKLVMRKLDKSLFSIATGELIANYILNNQKYISPNFLIENNSICEKILNQLKIKIEEYCIYFDGAADIGNKYFLETTKEMIESIVDNALLDFDTDNQANLRNLKVAETVEAGSEIISTLLTALENRIKN